MYYLSHGRRPASSKLVVLVPGRPPARTTTTAARRPAGCPEDQAAQLAYSEWLLTKLTV
jgi:hypothetical protein